MPGFRLASSDQQRIGTKYQCNACGLLLRDAMQTGCGHCYCSSCLGSLLLNGTSKMTCLQDQTEFLPNEVFRDNFMRRKVQAFIVHCTFMDDGCKWKGEVRHLESHTNSCEFLEIPCVYPECNLLVKKNDLHDHLEKTCKCRQESCGFCKQQINLNKMKLHHEKECPAYPVICEKCNKDGIPRAKLLEHQDSLVGDCDGVQGHNPFSQIGCSRPEVLSRSAQYGVGMTRDPGVMSTDPCIFTNHCDRVISNQLAQLQTESAKTRDLREKCQEHSERITALERKVSCGNFSASAPSSQGCGDAGGSDLTRSGINVENRTAVTLADLEERIRQQEFSSHDGLLLWKINEFARKRNDAVSGQQVSIYSPCFHTSRCGYKMCARIYLDGDGIGRGTHIISVYFVVMRGQYDALLRWPCRLIVTFMLLDQDNVEHLTHTFRPDPSCSSFQRPSGFQNSKSGFAEFCALGELNNHAYVRDDTMFLKVIVHEEELVNDQVSSLEQQGRVQAVERQVASVNDELANVRVQMEGLEQQVEAQKIEAERMRAEHEMEIMLLQSQIADVAELARAPRNESPHGENGQ